MDFWIERLKARGIDASAAHRRFEEEVIAFTDPDGLQLELVAHGGAESREPWGKGTGASSSRDPGRSHSLDLDVSKEFVGSKFV